MSDSGVRASETGVRASASGVRVSESGVRESGRGIRDSERGVIESGWGGGESGCFMGYRNLDYIVPLSEASKKALENFDFEIDMLLRGHEFFDFCVHYWHIPLIT